MSPRIICVTVYAGTPEDFDKKLSIELNDSRWNQFYYTITFAQDEHTFYAHIIFTERTDLISSITGG